MWPTLQCQDCAQPSRFLSMRIIAGVAAHISTLCAGRGICQNTNIASTLKLKAPSILSSWNESHTSTMDFHLNNIKIHASTKNTPQHLQLCDTAKKYTVLVFIGALCYGGPWKQWASPFINENNNITDRLFFTSISYVPGKPEGWNQTWRTEVLVRNTF